MLDPGGKALLILPSYRRLSGGSLQGAHVVIQRISAPPGEEVGGREGDNVRSHALIYDWLDFGRAGPALAPVAARLAADPTPAQEPATARLDQPRRTEPLPAPAAIAPSRAAYAIFGAFLIGATLRLGVSDCRTEAEFLDAFFLAVSRAPPSARGHLASASAGVASPDPGLQIAWWAAAGPRSDRELVDALAALGEARWRAPIPLGDEIPDDPRFEAFRGLVSPGFEQPTFHAHVRNAVRDALPRERLAGPRGEHPTPLDARDALARLDLHAAARAFGAAAANGEGLAPIAAALALLDRADWAVETEAVATLRASAGAALAAWMRAAICPPAAQFAELLDNASLAAGLAREIASGDNAVVEAVRRALATMPEADAERQRWARGALLPRDVRARDFWRDSAREGRSLAEALFDAVERCGPDDSGVAAALAEALIKRDRWETVREALEHAVARLGRRNAARSDALARQSRSLQMTCELSEALRRGLSQQRREALRLVG